MKKSKLIINIMFCSFIFAYIFLSFAKSIVKPVEIVYREKRYANKYNSIGLRNYVNGSMQNNIEDTLSDQVLLSSKLKGANNLIRGISVGTALNLLDSNRNEYVKVSKFYFYKGNLVYYPEKLNDLVPAFDKTINNYNNLISKYNNIDFYFFYIEKETDINFITNEKSGSYEYIKEHLNTNNISKFSINNFDEYKKYFYKTDHHWNEIGSYIGYKEIVKMFKQKNFIEPISHVCLNKTWAGSKSVYEGFEYSMRDEFCANKFDFSDIHVMVDRKDADYGKQNEYLNNSLDAVSYGDFYGWDNGEIVFNSNKKSKDNVLIFGDSYDNAIVKLLSKHFNTTVVVDLRWYENFVGEKFTLNYYLQKYNINKILFVGDDSFYASEDFLINIEED